MMQSTTLRARGLVVGGKILVISFITSRSPGAAASPNQRTLAKADRVAERSHNQTNGTAANFVCLMPIALCRIHWTGLSINP
jgi:hypothetical protein